MTRSREMPDLIAQLALIMISTAGLTAMPTTLAMAGLFGLAAALGLQAACRSRNAAVFGLLRRLSTDGPRKRSPGTCGQ